MKTLICNSGPAPTGTDSHRCSVCGSECWCGAQWRRMVADGDARPLCPSCAVSTMTGEIHVGTTPDSSADVLTDAAVMRLRHVGQPSLNSLVDYSGPRSAIRVACPRCGVGANSHCRTSPRLCPERVEANHRRFEDLKTLAMRWRSPCHGEAVWLVWRFLTDELRFEGVPCLRCDKTYAINMSASDNLDAAIDCDRLYPHLPEVLCWATEDAEPWKA